MAQKRQKQLESRGAVHPLSKLRKLNPFLDDDPLIKVGGRFRNANINTAHKNLYVLLLTHEVTVFEE